MHLDPRGDEELSCHPGPPHVVIRVRGAVGVEHLHEVIRKQSQERSLAAGSVVLIEYAGESAYRDFAGGVLLFLMDKLLATEPRAVVIVSPEQFDLESPSARQLRKLSMADERVHFLDTRAEAEAFIASLK